MAALLHPESCALDRRRMSIGDGRTRGCHLLVLLGLLSSACLSFACGASDPEPQPPEPGASAEAGEQGAAARPAEDRGAADPSSVDRSSTDPSTTDPSTTDPSTTDPAAAATDEAEPPEPEPAEPVVIEPGAQMGPIRLGMSAAELEALGLEERPSDPRSRRLGPYRVLLDDEDGVRRVEAMMDDLERVRIGEHTFEVGEHIHRMRDALGDCQWYEGGGERYRCRGGQLFLHTTHSLDPARYTLAIER